MTNLLPLDGRCPGCGYMHLVADPDGVITCTWQDCPAPTLVHDLLAKRDQHVHLIQFREDGFTAQHPLIERLRPEGLFACDLGDALLGLHEPPGLGMFRIQPGGTLDDMEQVDPDAVAFEVPTAPPSPEVEQEQFADALPIGAITGFPDDREVPDGFVRMGEHRQPIPDDCADLLTFILDREAGPIADRWPFWITHPDDGARRAAVPSRGDFGGRVQSHRQSLTPGEPVEEHDALPAGVGFIMKVR